MTSRITSYLPERIVIHPEVVALPLTDKVLRAFPSVPRQIEASPESCSQDHGQCFSLPEAGKKILFLTRHRGRVLKPCQGICENVSCCLYSVADFGSNCPLDCSYCLLQSYLNNPLLQLYMNTAEMLEEMAQELARRQDHFFRIGTGELTDSLAMDSVTGLSTELVPFFARQNNAVLELKTKTVHIENLQRLDHRGKTVVSWSVNADAIIASEEVGTAGLEERLQAARQCSEWGYPVGFHFDPLVRFPGWENAYLRTVEMIFDCMAGGKIVWISLGALRCPPGLLEILRARFPRSCLPLGEFVRGTDGKMRYFRPLRVELFRNLYAWIRKRNPQQTVYLCMESPRVWEQALGVRVEAKEVCALLDASVGFC